MRISDDDLLARAVAATRLPRQASATRKGWEFMGYVGSALVTDKGNVFTGVNVALLCGIGFCAEHSAVAEMVKNGETRIRRIVATTARGKIIPPCGRCRELLYQIDAANAGAEVLVARRRKRKLRELLPENWQKYFDKPLD